MNTTTPTTPAIIVLFGITGDLAQRKLLPALYHLFRDNLLHEKTVVLGITRRDVTTEEMVAQVSSSIEAADETTDPAALQRIQAALRMHTMSQTDPAEYRDLKQLLDDIETEKGVCMERLYYLSIPPQMFGPIVRNLGEQGLNQSCAHGEASTRLLIEKPFGYDLKSAHELIAETGEHFQEDQIFRIDHYLAKDAVQDIVAFRREYPEVEEIWNGRHVSAIEVTVYEKLGIEGRAVFYEEVGALRDFVQSHLMQVLALTAMDLPPQSDSDALHGCRLAFLQSIVPVGESEATSRALRGQYLGYSQEVENADSHTETFARVRFTSGSPRWQGTDLILQTGKAMAHKIAQVRLTVRGESGEEQALTFHIQPESGIEVSAADEPVSVFAPRAAAFNAAHAPTPENALGYERVFRDAILGDHTIFTTSQEVIAAWEAVGGIVSAWSRDDTGLVIYDKGSSSVET